MLRGRLESEGIFAAVVDEDGSRYAGGGVRVFVRADDVERALEVRRHIADASN
jgi:hypothetical protein